MTKFILLGFLQGLTEFLPVSSSGHLVIMQNLMDMRGLELELTVVVHLGTCLAVVIFFFRDIIALLKNMRLVRLVLLVTALTGFIGLLGKSFFERLFLSTEAVGLALLGTGVLLILSKQYADGRRTELTAKDAGVLGIVQGIAIIPGISRSGMTITSLMFRGLNRDVSFRFSFLVAIPAILGAAILEFHDLSCWCTIGDNIGAFTTAFIASFVSGLGALWLLRAMMRKDRFHYFGYYCIALGLIVLFLIR